MSWGCNGLIRIYPTTKATQGGYFMGYTRIYLAIMDIMKCMESINKHGDIMGTCNQQYDLYGCL